MSITEKFNQGVVLPAHPLALDNDGQIDLSAQAAISRYHLAAGAHGLAVGVHTTQFELHDDIEKLKVVWELASTIATEYSSNTPSDVAPILIAGLTGDTDQAVKEAELAAELGYEAALMSPWGMSTRSEETLLERAAAVGEVLPTIGFYLQEAVGGLHLSRDFWQQLFSLESVVAVKTAPFDRYRTNDVMQTLVHHDRWKEITVLTGNDDTIIHDLITPYRETVAGEAREVRATGGLLGQWAVGTAAAVRYTAEANSAYSRGLIPSSLLAKASALQEVNAAVFDVDNSFVGCVPGVNEVLRQQGVVPTANCLGSDRLSSGQKELIAEVRRRYPELLDEEFVSEHRSSWLSGPHS